MNPPHEGRGDNLEYNATIISKALLHCNNENPTQDPTMECTVTWTGATGTRSNMGFVAETGSGHVLTMDGAPDAAKP